MPNLPHPIPYQGSKRNLAPIIGRHLPGQISTWFEPFAGSAAMTIWAVINRKPKRVVLGDSLTPMMDLWNAIIRHPGQVAARYNEIWHGQRDGDASYYYQVRERYNQDHDPIDLLYLSCRCVKNAVRFNAKGGFSQSVDKRRLGMRPAKMREAVEGASTLLRGRTEIRRGDWMETLIDAAPGDFVYMDPPYLGTSTGRDRRYAESMSQERLVRGLSLLNERNIQFALSYDGSCGEKTYGAPLPDSLHMVRISIHAGRSSQATLNGNAAETIESLYLSKGQAAPSLMIHSRTSSSQELQPSLIY